MNLKKKVIIGMVAGLFAVATVFNMSMLNDNGAGDVSLDAIALMAQADDNESGGSGLANLCCKIWDVSVKIYWYGTEIECDTGGGYKCNDCPCPN